ncbi:hypothetical protein JI721_14340 [Alicyclobacillus cycloheptanicus]|uniref:NnrS protein n=1 Tax=Alicyclobacillus cycloheptanicus TaxID=1457 RepID=A0ABT9XL87_9BACL|nr:hypothetical protein [Alicyclobacillus cycloheptanicus]MDQ0191055.1 hypothetical protein [Alicyclobacillus cycloheptanicus]WDM00851.1 hypothetical protein JI721_14340 [Alicyclobacillus cycloheptanicus]
MGSNGQSLIGRLPKAFIAIAFLNFLVGAGLGGWMAVQPSAWGLISSIHGEINPFGWLTMLIYGMTYAVLAISAGIRPPKAWIGWLHLVFAELAVLVVVAGWSLHAIMILHIGLGIQFAAPVVFLVNILSAVFSSRRKHRESAEAAVEDRALEAHPLGYLRRDPAYQSTDRVGQRGTDVSLMLFLIGAGWMFIRSLTPGQMDDVSAPGALYLIYYGWIAGTILSVALHLFPRFTGVRISAKMMSVLQVAWGLTVILGTAGLTISAPNLANIGSRLMGIVFAGSSAVYLWALLRPGRQAPATAHVQPASRLAWITSWLFFLVLGICLVIGLDPLSLAAMHMLFLGFATTLVYGIGYTMFQHLLQRRPVSRAGSTVQVGTSILGAVLMVIAFLDMLTPRAAEAFGLLAVGGTLAWAGATGFLLLWATARHE